MNFFIDTGNVDNIPVKVDLTVPPTCSNQENDLDPNLSIKEILTEYKTSLPSFNRKSKGENIFDKFTIEMGWIENGNQNKKQKRNPKAIDVDGDTIKTKRNVEDVLKKSVLTPEFESLKQVPPFEVAETQLKAHRKREREKTKGAKWYGLPATEMTREIKDDLQILQMRSVLDPKRFYKKNDLNVLPKYFQIGKVLDSPLEFYNNRLTKKEKKKSLVDELLADAEFNKYNKKRYKEIIEQKRSKAWKQAKKRGRNKSKSN